LTYLYTILSAQKLFAKDHPWKRGSSHVLDTHIYEIFVCSWWDRWTQLGILKIGLKFSIYLSVYQSINLPTYLPVFIYCINLSITYYLSTHLSYPIFILSYHLSCISLLQWEISF
jgi:hypothetical protein